MQTGPRVKLAIDLQKIDRYFPLDFNEQKGINLNLVIERRRFDKVFTMLQTFNIQDDIVVREICFILLWLEKEVSAGEGPETYPEKFNQMRAELDKMKDYLLKNRIISVNFEGESGRDKPGEELTLKEEINIDRLCDGIRSIFSDEFNHDKQKRRSKGLTTWQRKKMIRIHNNFLNYFEATPSLDELTLEDQNDLIVKISNLAGLPG